MSFVGILTIAISVVVVVAVCFVQRIDGDLL